MMSDVIYILFGLHILLAIVYAIDFRYDRGNLQKTLLRFVICFLIPIFGFAFLWFSDYFEKRMKQIGKVSIPQDAFIKILKNEG